MTRRRLLGGLLVLTALLVAFHSRIAEQLRVLGVPGLGGGRSGCAKIPQTAGPPRLRVLPVRYVADRWFARPVTLRGDTTEFFLDTGGGGVWAVRHTLERLGYDPKFVAVEEGDSVFTGGTFPTFRQGADIPPPRCDPVLNGFGSTATLREMEGANGMLGHPWFAERVWVFDYPRQTLSVYEVPPAPREFDTHTVPMTLLNPPRKNFPRIYVVVAGDTISMLLDTGATSWLTPAAVAAMGGGPTVRASSFVASRLWNRWRASHPTWRVIPAGEARLKADLIEVPQLMVGGFEVGPIWFAKRSDAVYDNMMSPQMDQAVDASIGGAAFRSFRMTLDYPNQRVTFER